VFVPLTQLYLRHQWGKQWDRKAPVRLCDLAINCELKYPDQEIVLLSQVLVHEVNTGYQHTTNIQVKKFNGVEIRNLQHLVSLVEDAQNQSEFVRFDLEFERAIILERKQAEQVRERRHLSHSDSFVSNTNVLLSIGKCRSSESTLYPIKQVRQSEEARDSTTTTTTATTVIF